MESTLREVDIWVLKSSGFMGLGMPTPPPQILSLKLHLLQSEWNQPTSAGNMLRQSLEVFQMETGFCGNVLEMDYGRYSALATGGWWKQFWCLSQKYSVHLKLGSKWLIPLLRVGDRALMDVVCSTDHFTSSEWCIINRVRKYKGVHSIGDFVMCDGSTVDPWILNRQQGSSSRVFSVEKPTRRDFNLFARAIRLVTSENLRLNSPLGQFVNRPHRHSPWFVEPDGSYLYKALDDSTYLRYIPLPSSRTHRTFSEPSLFSGQFSRTYHASVSLVPSADSVKLLSTAKVYSPPLLRRSFLDRLRSLPNQTLWKTFVVDGDGSWIYRGLLRNTLVLMSDGSYDERRAPDVCSCAAMIKCGETGLTASVTWSERSDRFSADNYRAELLGAIALQLLVRTACEGKYISPSMRPQIGCDNAGVVHHGNHPWRPVASRQLQADLLRFTRSWFVHVQ